MSPIFSADELHSVVGGKLSKKNWEVQGISIDSREIKKHDLFTKNIYFVFLSALYDKDLIVQLIMYIFEFIHSIYYNRF